MHGKLGGADNVVGGISMGGVIFHPDGEREIQYAWGIRTSSNN